MSGAHRFASTGAGYVASSRRACAKSSTQSCMALYGEVRDDTVALLRDFGEDAAADRGARDLPLYPRSDHRRLVALKQPAS